MKVKQMSKVFANKHTVWRRS